MRVHYPEMFCNGPPRQEQRTIEETGPDDRQSHDTNLRRCDDHFIEFRDGSAAESTSTGSERSRQKPGSLVDRDGHGVGIRPTER
jgi:hypothetical protein